MCDVDQQVEFVKTIATDLEHIVIAALADHGHERARRLLDAFFHEDEKKDGSRATLIRMVVACMTEPRVTCLLPEELTFDALPPLAVLAKQYHFQNAIEAAHEEADPDLRRALLQRACEISNDSNIWLADPATAGSHRLLHQEFFAPEWMLQRH